MTQQFQTGREGAWGGVINVFFLDDTNRNPMEGFTAGLRGLEQYI
nr:hypothetical protein [Nitrosomonas eutropha]